MQAQAFRKPVAVMPPGTAISASERPLDLVHLSRQTLGDRALEIELLGLFDKQAGQIMARLDSSLCCGDQKWRHDLSHTLKGSARAIGAVRVAAAAQAYEDALAAGLKESDLEAYVLDMKQTVEEAQLAIRTLLADA
jgi:HPt (histidine-containing phosphotransfer) domain-containing protein